MEDRSRVFHIVLYLDNEEHMIIRELITQKYNCFTIVHRDINIKGHVHILIKLLTPMTRSSFSEKICVPLSLFRDVNSVFIEE